MLSTQVKCKINHVQILVFQCTTNKSRHVYFFFLTFLMWTIFEVFIEFTSVLFLFYALVFWP